MPRVSEKGEGRYAYPPLQKWGVRLSPSPPHTHSTPMRVNWQQLTYVSSATVDLVLRLFQLFTQRRQQFRVTLNIRDVTAMTS